MFLTVRHIYGSHRAAVCDTKILQLVGIELVAFVVVGKGDTHSGSSLPKKLQHGFHLGRSPFIHRNVSYFPPPFLIKVDNKILQEGNPHLLILFGAGNRLDLDFLTRFFIEVIEFIPPWDHRITIDL